MTAARPPRVLFVVSPPSMGGSNVSLQTLLEHLEGRVERIFAGPPGTMSELLLSGGTVEAYWPLPRRGGSAILGRLRQMTALLLRTARERKDISVIHANATSGMRLATLTGAILRIPVVVWAHDGAGSSLRRKTGWLCRFLLPATTWAAVSSTAAEVVVNSRLASAEDIVIVPNPIDPASILADRNTESGPVTVGFLGRRGRGKGFDILPAVIPDAGGRWLVFTNRSDEPEWEPVWSALDALPPSAVSIEGRATDVRDAYRRCDIVFVPSRQESFGRIVAEAMLNGIPVVASDIPPFRDQVGDDEAGLLFAPDDAQAAAAAVRTLVADPALREKLGNAGRLRARRLSPDMVADSMFSLYQAAAAREEPA